MTQTPTAIVPLTYAYNSHAGVHVQVSGMNCHARSPVANVSETEKTAYEIELDSFRSKHSVGITAFASAVVGLRWGPT